MLNNFIFNQFERGLVFTLKHFFFFGKSTPSNAAERRSGLLGQGARKLDLDLEGLYPASKARCKTNNVVLLALHKPFEKYHPRNYKKYLERGADVVLWNPSDWTPKKYEKDLIKVLRKI